MTATALDDALRPLRAVTRWPASRIVLLVALAAFVAPGLAGLMRGVWTLEQGAQGPIILASGLWLLAREAKGMTLDPPGAAALWIVLPPLLAGYLFGRMVGLLWFEWACTYAVLLVVLYAHVGRAGMAPLWFPLTYLLFLIPPPYSLIAPITHSRKLWLSTTATDLLAVAGFDVARTGTTLYVDQYELLVADACAGMNSLVSLTGIGLFYVYVLHRADWRYAALLAALIVPVAMVANLARILILMLVTHYAGIEAAEGLLHLLAGVLMFGVALACLIALDALLAPLRRRLARW